MERVMGFRANMDDQALRFIANIPVNKDVEFTFGKDGKPFYVEGPYDFELISKMKI